MNFIQKFGEITTQEQEEIDQIVLDHIKPINEEINELSHNDFYEVEVDDQGNHIMRQVTNEERLRWNGRRRIRRDPHPTFLGDQTEDDFLNPRINDDNFIGHMPFSKLII